MNPFFPFIASQQQDLEIWNFDLFILFASALRFHVYKAEKFELFMIDFCYFMNFSGKFIY